MTVKGPGKVARAEFEYKVPIKDAHLMLGLCKAKLSKRRYFVPYQRKIWHVDRFLGRHLGLWLAEIELSSEDEAFHKPAWLGREVTQDPRFTNASLAEASSSPKLR